MDRALASAVPVDLRSRDEVSAGRVACHAASMQLYLFANGDVGPCCRNSERYGNVAERGLLEIWRGVARSRLASTLGEGSFGPGCEVCASEDMIEGRAGSLAGTFDYWNERLGEDDVWPVRMEFELSNRCNLQCVQCNGDLSSTIRSRREHRSPMPHAYDDSFFEELRLFLPQLRHASFVGGEPFLGREHHRVWELMEELAPHVPCTITTNATVWNARVEHVLSALEVHPVVSIDGITAGTYESIRLGGRFSEVMANVERLREYCTANDRVLNLNFCLMPSNVHEFAEVLLFAEERGIYVNAQVVRSPVDHSLAHLPRSELVPIVERLARQDEHMRRSLVVNARTWIEELQRLSSWLAPADRSSRSAWTAGSPRILMFARQGEGRTSVDAELERLSAAGHEVHSLRVGPDERVEGCTPVLAARLGIEVAALEGRSLAVLQQVVRHYDVVESTKDRYEAVMDLGNLSGRLVMVPVRDESGWADEAVALFAFDVAAAAGVASGGPS